MTKRSRVAVLIAGFAIVWGGIYAQEPKGPIARRLAEGLSANQKALQDYTWTSRWQITLDGELDSIKVYRMSHDAEGRLGSELVSSEAAEDSTGKRKRSSKKKKKAAELIEGLRTRIDAYIHMTPEHMSNFVMNSKFWYGRGKDGTEMQIQARDVVFRGDSMDVWLDDSTKELSRLQLLTAYEGEALDLDVEFRKLEDDLSYPARSIVETEIKEQFLEIRIENSDYEKK